MILSGPDAPSSRRRLDTRWHKVLRDLSSHKTRSLLVVLSIAVGVLSVGTVSGARAIMVHALNSDYAAARAASATLVTDPFSPGLLPSIRRVPGVREVEARYRADTRLEVRPCDWKDLQLLAIPDFRHMRVARVWPQSGQWPPPAGTMLLERGSLEALKVRVGQTLQVETADGRRHMVRIAGSAHDINPPATYVSGINYGYITYPTLHQLGPGNQVNQVYLTVAGNALDRDHIRLVAARVRSVIQRSGRRVLSTLVPVPGRFWASDAVGSMVLLLTILGVSSLFMSGFLVINTITALMAQHVRTIGVMKAVGAVPRQIVTMYLATILCYCALALVLAVPLAALGSLLLVGYSAHILDLDSGGFSLPWQVLGVELFAGLVVPMLAALAPVLAGSRITVHEALAAPGRGGEMNVEAWPRWTARVPRPLLLSAANTFRRKSRFALTLATMILGGAIFVAVLSVRASLQQTLDDVMGYRSYDVQVSFSRPYPVGQVTRVALGVPGVRAAEGWGIAAAQRREANGTDGADIIVMAPPPQSTLIRPVLLGGRWLRPGDSGSVVLNSDALKDNPDLRLGSGLTLMVGNRRATWQVVGVVRGVLTGPTAYVALPTLAGVTGERGSVDQLAVVTQRHDASSQAQAEQLLVTALGRAGFSVGPAQTTADVRTVEAANFNIIVVFLLSMALLLALVGGLGLMGTMTISVLERTREVGIMRAVGASHGDVLKIVTVEGLLVGVVSWAIGALAALPISPPLSQAVGAAFLNAPLAYTFSTGGAALWLVGMLAIAGLASVVPAWNASRLRVRDGVAYE
jgi:putative ABC transport system permease protein